MQRVYLDHAATTPVRPDVLEAFRAATESTFGNASSVHSFGQDAKKLLEESRDRVARAIGAESPEIIFTSGGTESDNLAITGVARALKNRGKHIITTAIEHPAVLNTCRSLEDEGFEVTYLPVDSECVLSMSALAASIKEETVLVSAMYANNETGSIQPVADIAKLTREHGVLLHTDAVQALGKVDIDVDSLGVDLLSMSAHKIYGPKGVGALFVREGTPIDNLFYGGHHERGIRPGTENVPGIAAFATAVELAVQELPESAERLRALKARLAEGVLANVDGAHENGSRGMSLPNILNVGFEGVDGEALLLSLDLMGIGVSTGSACSSGSTDPSHVLLTMGIRPRLAQASIRFSLGRGNTAEEIDRVVEVLPPMVQRLRALSPLIDRHRPGIIEA